LNTYSTYSCQEYQCKVADTVGQLIIVKAGSVPVIDGLLTVIVDDDVSNVRASVMVIVPVVAPEVVTVIPELVSVKDIPEPEMVLDPEPLKVAPPVAVALGDVVGGPICDALVANLTCMVPKEAPVIAPLVVNGIVMVMVWEVPVPVADAVGAVHCARRSPVAPILAIVKMLIKFEFADATAPVIVINPIINNRTLPFIC
jgi:hypothetical protein